MAVAMASCSYASAALRQSFAFAHSRPPANSRICVSKLRQKQKQQLSCSLFANGFVSKALQGGSGRVGVGATVSAEAGRVVAAAAAAPSLPDALLFDCDGVLVDTERDGHRISFNIAFSEKAFETVWDVDLYGELLKIGGGKERMTHYFNKVGWPEAAPSDEPGKKELVAGLHKRKTDLFMDLVEKGSLPLRPGVASLRLKIINDGINIVASLCNISSLDLYWLVDQALDSGVNVAVCSTSNEKAVAAIVRIMLGPERASKIRIFAGDVVPRKKPDPAIYLLASTTLGVAPERCVVVEDSHIGLTAAKAAGMKCIVTKSGYTEEEDFSAADAIFECIGDPPTANFDLEFAASLLTLPADVVA